MPKRVKLPNGQTASFPDDMSNDQISAVLQKQFPVKGLNPNSIEDISNLPPASTPSRPGLIKRLGEAVGVPTSKEELEGMQPTTLDVLGGPPVAAAKMIGSFGKNAYQQGKKSLGEVRESIQNIRHGGPVGANVGKAVYGIESGIMRGGPSSLVGSGAVQSFGEDIGNKDLGITPNYAGAAGDALGVLINALMLRSSRGRTPEERTNYLTFAAGGNKREIGVTLSDLLKSTDGKVPDTVGGMLDTVQQAKKNMNTESGLALQPIRGAKTVPTGVADRVRNLITPDMYKSPEGLAKIQKIKDVAARYDQEWSYEQLDADRSTRQQELSPYYKKGSAAQFTVQKTDLDAAIDRAVVGGIQDIVYPQMDAVAKKPQGYFRSLKQRQGNLIALEDTLKDRITTLEDLTGKIQGDPRLLGENWSMYGSHLGKPGISIHRLQDVIRKPNPMNIAGKAVEKGFAKPGITSRAYIYSLPIRYLMLENQPKSPKELRDKAKELAQ